MSVFVDFYSAFLSVMHVPKHVIISRNNDFNFIFKSLFHSWCTFCLWEKCPCPLWDKIVIFNEIHFYCKMIDASIINWLLLCKCVKCDTGMLYVFMFSNNLAMCIKNIYFVFLKFYWMLNLLYHVCVLFFWF